MLDKCVLNMLSSQNKDVLPRASHIIINWINYTVWAASWQNQQNESAPCEDSDQPGHLPSLIRVFAVRMNKSWVLSYLLSAHRRLWLDWAHAQADLSLGWAPSFCWFCHVVAHIIWSSVLENSTFRASKLTKCNWKELFMLHGIFW